MLAHHYQKCTRQYHYYICLTLYICHTILYIYIVVYTTLYSIPIRYIRSILFRLSFLGRFVYVLLLLRLFSLLWPYFLSFLYFSYYPNLQHAISIFLVDIVLLPFVVFVCWPPEAARACVVPAQQLHSTLTTHNQLFS